MKKIVLLIDGTGNKDHGAGSPKNSNVAKLLHNLVNDGSTQCTKYMKGVGTDIITKYVAGATGWGTAKRIKKAYKYLSSNYNPGDEVYLFGFSRGAFAARSLAGFVEAVGLLLKKNLHFVKEAYDLYVLGAGSDKSWLREYLRTMIGTQDSTNEQENSLPIYFIGVWDTVSALGGEPLESTKPLTVRFLKHHIIELPANVTHARQALSLHDLRESFAPVLWTGRNPKNRLQTLEQVWFPGAHSNVGGGYKKTSDLSDVALDWMTQEAECPEGSTAAGNKSGLLLQTTGHWCRNISKAIKAQPCNTIDGPFIGCTPTTRAALENRTTFPTETQDSFYLHEIACRRLLEAASTDYSKLPNPIEAKFEEIDELSLQFHLELCFNENKLPIGFSQPKPCNKGVAKLTWWVNKRVNDVAKCKQTVDTFIGGLGNPLRGHVEFRQALCLFILCGGQTSLDEFANEVMRQANNGANNASTANATDLAQLQQRLDRLSAVLAEVSNCVAMLPLIWQCEVEDVSKNIKTAIASFQTSVRQRRLKLNRGRGITLKSPTPAPAPPPKTSST